MAKGRGQSVAVTGSCRGISALTEYNSAKATSLISPISAAILPPRPLGGEGRGEGVTGAGTPAKKPPHPSPLPQGGEGTSWLRRGLHAVFMIVGLVTCGIVLGTFVASTARADGYTDAITGLASPAFADKVTAIETLGRLGDGRAIPVLEAM